jgi:hypothetical protein
MLSTVLVGVNLRNLRMMPFSCPAFPGLYRNLSFARKGGGIDVAASLF